MAKAKELYKKTEKALHVSRDTIGSIVHKFKVKGTVVTRPGRVRKRSHQWLQPDF